MPRPSTTVKVCAASHRAVDVVLYSFSASHCGWGALAPNITGLPSSLVASERLRVGGSVDTNAVNPSSPSQPQSLFVLANMIVEWDLKIRLRLIRRLAFRFMRSRRDFSNTP